MLAAEGDCRENSYRSAAKGFSLPKRINMQIQAIRQVSEANIGRLVPW